MSDLEEISLFRDLPDTDIGKKICSMTEAKIDRLIEAWLSRIPEAELERIVQPVLCRLGEALFIGICEMFTDLGEQLYRELVVPASTLLFWGFVATISINCGRSIYQWRSNKQLQSSKPTTNAAKQERPKPKRSIFWSKYSINPDQGLKCIGKIYIQETTTDSRQEVEQHQEDTSRDVVPSSRSTGICTSYF